MWAGAAFSDWESGMIDAFGRKITYLRVSVTDRCDLRCVYCMAEDTEFQPRSETLSLEELERLCGAFVRLGVRKIRLTGGEPLIRRNVGSLIGRLGKMVDEGSLDELALTTNGTQLARHAESLAAAGIRRVNVSLDTLNAKRFAAITRRTQLAAVLDGIMAAKAAGLSVKINTVALKGINEDEFDRLIGWCGQHGFDLCLIEAMPLGEFRDEGNRPYLPLPVVRARLQRRWTLADTDCRTGGPARYSTIAETGCRIGFITPMTHGFCGSCNRVRVTCTGTLYPCLGQEKPVDLRSALRASESDHLLDAAIERGIAAKPTGHGFVTGDHMPSTVARTMSVTGG